MSSIRKGALLLGTVVKINRIGIEQIPCAQIRCRLNQFSEHLKMYFAKPSDLWALDKEIDVNLGDTVLIGPIENKDRPMASVSHIIKRVVMPYGNMVDPVTRKRIYQNEFVDDRKIRQELMAELVSPYKQDAIGFETRHLETKEKVGRLRQQ